MNDITDRTIVDTAKVAIDKEEQGKHEEFRLTFMVLEGSELDFGKVFQFSNLEVTIGRGRECDIALNDERVSRRHCRVTALGSPDVEEIVLEDLQSTNGTSVNGQAAGRVVLHSGDRIEVGSTILRVTYNDEIEEKYHSRLFSMATLDGLTGVYTRRYIMNALENQNRIARRNKRVYSVIILDIDDFKTINDVYGHLAGDDYLKMVAFSVARILREQDLLGRYGGEEFLVIVPETELAGALTLAERIRKRIEKAELQHGTYTLRTTLSLGVAQFGVHGDEARSVLKAADDALYRAKQSGKNRCVVAGDDR